MVTLLKVNVQECNDGLGSASYAEKVISSLRLIVSELYA